MLFQAFRSPTYLSISCMNNTMWSMISRIYNKIEEATFTYYGIQIYQTLCIPKLKWQYLSENIWLLLNFKLKPILKFRKCQIQSLLPDQYFMNFSLQGGSLQCLKLCRNHLNLMGILWTELFLYWSGKLFQKSIPFELHHFSCLCMLNRCSRCYSLSHFYV